MDSQPKMKVLSKDSCTIEQANLSKPVPSGYCVGAVLVQQAHVDLDVDMAQEDPFRVVATGYSRELPGNTHAEECCLLKLAVIEAEEREKNEEISALDTYDEKRPHSKTWKEWIMYSTMEPCSERLSGNRSCSDQLIESGVKRVYVGVREPDRFIKTVVGVENLMKQGIEVIHIPGFEKECLAPNCHILK
ncbi:hypothetical protein BGZ76_008938 [Entomortierella beljakovae]|nr:hypothetical protein BGZ76_008938 [Entomortierella beljakovae]